MAKKKAETDIEALLGGEEKEAPVEAKEEAKEEIKEDDLVVAPVEEKPLQTFAKPAQPFKKPKEDAPKGVGGSYYIDATGTRVKR